MANYMVYDIGGSAVKWSVITDLGQILISGKIGISKTLEEFFEELASLVETYKEQFLLEGIAISAPGAVDSVEGSIKSKSAIPYIYGINFKEVLQEKTGLKVEIENDGEAGLKRAMSEEFDLFILDLMLPGVDGFEICKKIRETKNTPIIMISAKKDDIDKIRGLGLGADDYITKPFSPSEMVARVKAHLSRYERLIGSGTPANDIIEIRGLKIDKTARRVYVNGEEKNFTTKEFDLLAFLAQNPNHVFTKEELFSKIWDMESIGDIATVTVHIKKIREKIEMNTAKPQYIETIWGVGYRFKV